MTLGSLFAGIGGFELAGLFAGIYPVWSNDINPKCCNVLRKNFDHRVIEKSIKELSHEELESVDIICGGDPCQPHSRAGLGKGAGDHRFLWPEMLRIIQGLHPSFVLNENVDGTVPNGIVDRKIDDLERIGYTCQAYSIPAEATGALHKRDRIWIVAYDPGGYSTNRNPGGLQSKKQGLQKRDHIQHIGEPIDLWPFDSYADIKRLEEQYAASKSGILSEGTSRYFGFGPAPHGHISRDIIESGIIRMLNGLPEGMDYPDRNARIAMLGNSIVWQVAYEFLKWMKDEVYDMVRCTGSSMEAKENVV